MTYNDQLATNSLLILQIIIYCPHLKYGNFQKKSFRVFSIIALLFSYNKEYKLNYKYLLRIRHETDRKLGTMVEDSYS